MSFWPEAYAEHAPGLRNFLRRRLRSVELAEDLTQDTFVRAMSSGNALRDPGRIRAYLYQTAYRLLLNHRRRPSMVEAESLAAGVIELRAHGGSGDGVHERELREAVDAALATLSDDQARAFRWAVLEQRSYAEIEAHTGWSRSKVKVSVFRARQRVMQRLLELGLGLEGEERSR